MLPLHAVLLGIVEGVTEFLPVSSTGHLILASNLLGIGQTEFQKSFEIIIQLGAIASVVALYFRRFFDIQLLKKLFVAFIPTAVIGLALYRIVKTYFLGNEVIVLWSLFLGGIVLIVFELVTAKQQRTGTIENLTYSQCALIGLFQAISIIPGVSRSAATIVGGLWLGMERRAIVEFSFLLAVPTMLAATGLDLVKNASAFTSDQFGILSVGFIVSFIVALVSIKILLNIVRRHTFIPFGVYRIIVAVIFWFFVL